jgi:F0F1-type ATP synthase delta subunit
LTYLNKYDIIKEVKGGLRMISNKMSQLKQDLTEIKSVIDDLKPYESYLDGYLDNLKDRFDILEEHLKDHIETIENFIQDVD